MIRPSDQNSHVRAIDNVYSFHMITSFIWLYRASVGSQQDYLLFIRIMRFFDICQASHFYDAPKTKNGLQDERVESILHVFFDS